MTALKYLASAVGTHSFTEPLGGVTILFWSETASEEQDKAMLSLLTGKAQAEITTNADYIDYIRNTCFARPVNPTVSRMMRTPSTILSALTPEMDMWRVSSLNSKGGLKSSHKALFGTMMIAALIMLMPL